MRANQAVALEDPITLDALLGSTDRRAFASWLFGGLQSAGAGLVLTALFVLFLLTSATLIERRLHLAISRAASSKLLLERCARGVETYLWVQTITGLINAAASGLIMFAVGLDHWALWTIALFALSFIPFIGVAIGSIGPALFAILQFPSLWPSLIVFAGIQVVAFVVGNLIWPKLQADRQNIDPSSDFSRSAPGAIIWGLPGAFLAVPLTLALIFLLAGNEKLQWISILLSNDGDPLAAAGPAQPSGS